MTNQCAVCGIAASQRCSGCRSVVYCGKDHQKEHWKKGHKADCKCYEVAINNLLGRYLRATRDIKRGEIILREAPLINGPKVACTPLCLGCYRTLSAPVHPQRNYYKCRGCAWPLCGRDCEKSANHIDECKLMASRKFLAKIDYNAAQPNRKESAYCVILPLRCMLLKQMRPSLFERFAQLEDHLAERIDTPLYAVLRANLVTFIQTILGMHEWEANEVLRIAAILDTNAFDVRQTMPERRLRAIYPSAAMISHDCISNARHTFDENMNILFIAKVDIAKGSVIATSYTQPLRNTLWRRIHLKQAKCFGCTCKRCSDPSELNTFTGAILCCKCKVGKIISTNPLDDTAVWRCQLCPHEISAHSYNQGNATMEKEISALDKNSPPQFEEFLHKYRDTLHERNTHILQVKYALTQLYGNAPGYRLDEMCDADVKRKIELCREMLEVADLFDAGASLFRGNLLIDLQEALMAQISRDNLREKLSLYALQVKLNEPRKLITEAAEIMKFDPGVQDILQNRLDALKQTESH